MVDRTRTQINITQDYEFVVTPTSPPSTSVYVRGGRAWPNSNFWFFLYYNCQIPFVTVDFAQMTEPTFDESHITDMVFANAYYYKPAVFSYNGAWIHYGQPTTTYIKFFLHSGNEYVTAAEAEAEIDLSLNGGSAPGTDVNVYHTSSFSMCGIIFRNNGTTDMSGAIMPIEKVNRGGSYLYRDIRRNHNWIHG